MPISMVLGATTTAVVWLTIGLVTTVALVAMVIALVRHVLLLGRTVMRFSDEAGPILGEIERQDPARRASSGGRRGGTPAG